MPLLEAGAIWEVVSPHGYALGICRFVGAGYTQTRSMEISAMMIPGVILLVMAFVYFRFTKDTPAGNFCRHYSPNNKPKVHSGQQP